MNNMIMNINMYVNMNMNVNTSMDDYECEREIYHDMNDEYYTSLNTVWHKYESWIWWLTWICIGIWIRIWTGIWIHMNMNMTYMPNGYEYEYNDEYECDW